MQICEFDDTWTLVERSFSSENNRKFEGLFTTGSGQLHVRGSLEEHLSDAPQNVSYTRMPANVTSEKFPEFKARWGTYVPGIYGNHPLLSRELINLPSFIGIVPIVNGERLDLTSAKVSSYRRALDMKRAVLSRELVWQVGGIDVTAKFERFVSYVHPWLSVQRLTIQASENIDLAIESSIDADVRTNGYDHFVEVACNASAEGAHNCRILTDSSDEVTIYSHILGFGDVEPSVENRRVVIRLSGSVKKGEQVSISKNSAVTTSRDTSRPNREEILANLTKPYEELLEEHTEAWSRLWENSDVIIQGDDKAQVCMRASLFHLLRSHPRADISIDAKGYAGEGYFGRFFWDSEIYLMPFFLYTDPEKAWQLLQYRVNSLPSAKENATLYGYKGARFAWEADNEGRESCAVWQYRDHEIHVTADVIYAINHFAAATGQDIWSSPDVAEVLIETALFWRERVTMTPQRVDLLGVMGPDEYGPITHNNAYTNRMVKFACDLAYKVGSSRGMPAEILADFKRIADELPILRRTDGLILENELFDRLEEPNFEQRWKDRTKTYAAQVSQERLYRSKNLKQADVLMMLYLFEHEAAEKDLRQSWDYYVPYTTHDSSLSAGVHSILASRLGRNEIANDFWWHSATLDVDISRSGAAEGVHIACCAATWMAAVFGFAGVRSAVGDTGLFLEPQLPKNINSLAFPLVWKGAKLYIELTSRQTKVTLRQSTDRPLLIKSGKREYQLDKIAGATVVIDHN